MTPSLFFSHDNDDDDTRVRLPTHRIRKQPRERDRSSAATAGGCREGARLARADKLFGPSQLVAPQWSGTLGRIPCRLFLFPFTSLSARLPPRYNALHLSLIRVRPHLSRAHPAASATAIAVSTPGIRSLAQRRATASLWQHAG